VLIRLFKTNQPAILLGLPLVAMMFWWVYFVVPGTLQEEITLFGFTFPVWLLIVLQLILSIFEAIIFNKMINDLELFDRQTFIPALCYVILSAMLVPSGKMQATTVPNFFILQAMHTLLIVYRQNTARSEAFLAGFLLGIASLIWWPLIVLSLFGIIAIGLLKSLSWREVALFITGICLPGFLFSSFFFAVTGEWFLPEVQFVQKEPVWLLFGEEAQGRILVVLFSLIFLFGVFLFISRLKGTILRIRKQRLVWIWLTIFLFSLLGSQFILPGEVRTMLIIPAAFYISFLIVHTVIPKIIYSFFYAMIVFFFLLHLHSLGII
jgi:hypothetical protein